MIRFLLPILTMLTLTACIDPNAPRYTNVLQPIVQRAGLMSAETVDMICKQEGLAAHREAEERYRRNNSSTTYRSDCDLDQYGNRAKCRTTEHTHLNASYAYLAAQVGRDAERAAYASCLGRLGYTVVQQCYKNCMP